MSNKRTSKLSIQRRIKIESASKYFRSRFRNLVGIVISAEKNGFSSLWFLMDRGGRLDCSLFRVGVFASHVLSRRCCCCCTRYCFILVPNSIGREWKMFPAVLDPPNKNPTLPDRTFQYFGPYNSANCRFELHKACLSPDFVGIQLWNVWSGSSLWSVAFFYNNNLMDWLYYGRIIKP